MNEKIIEIKYRGVGLQKKLSNLYPHTFQLEGVSYSSMEAFFACLRTDDESLKPNFRNKFGYIAWKLGHQFDWTEKQVVYYNGVEIDRHSEDYTNLITSAFDALFENPDFKEALTKSQSKTLKHSMGKSSKSKSLLTRSEFIDQLNRLRKKLDEYRFFNLFESVGQFL